MGLDLVTLQELHTLPTKVASCPSWISFIHSFIYSVDVYWAPTICQALCYWYVLTWTWGKHHGNTWKLPWPLYLEKRISSWSYTTRGLPFWASNLKKKWSETDLYNWHFNFFLPELTKKMPPLHSCYLAWLLLWRLSVCTKWTRSRVGNGLTILLPIIVGTLLNEVGFHKLFEM